jgi:hypothetical protein
MKPALLTAIHEQPCAVVTFTIPLPPVESKDCDVGLIENEQPPPVAPACVTVCCKLPICMTPVRGDVLVLVA